MQHLKSRSLFTLIEVLVVVGVVAILMSMFLPVLHKAQVRAHYTRWIAYSAHMRIQDDVLAHFDFDVDGLNSGFLINASKGVSLEPYNTDLMHLHLGAVENLVTHHSSGSVVSPSSTGDTRPSSASRTYSLPNLDRLTLAQLQTLKDELTAEAAVLYGPVEQAQQTLSSAQSAQSAAAAALTAKQVEADASDNPGDFAGEIANLQAALNAANSAVASAQQAYNSAYAPYAAKLAEIAQVEAAMSDLRNSPGGDVDGDGIADTEEESRALERLASQQPIRISTEQGRWTGKGSAQGNGVGPIAMGVNIPVNLTNELSYETWIRLDPTQAGGVIIGLDNDDALIYVYLERTSATAGTLGAVVEHQGVRTTLSTSVSLEHVQYRHVGLSMNLTTDTISLYYDGSLAVREMAVDVPDFADAYMDITIGEYYDSHTPYDGLMDQISLHLRELSASDFRDAYRSGSR